MQTNKGGMGAGVKSKAGGWLERQQGEGGKQSRGGEKTETVQYSLLRKHYLRILLKSGNHYRHTLLQN